MTTTLDLYPDLAAEELTPFDWAAELLEVFEERNAATAAAIEADPENTLPGYVLQDRGIGWPLDDLAAQDDLFEVGAPGDAARTPREACRAFKAADELDKAIDVGYCLRYTRGWYLVAALYASASESLAAAEVKHRVSSFSDAPRGTIGYSRGGGGSQWGHVWLNLGGGLAGTTDWPRGRLGIVRAETMLQAFGYSDKSQWYWSPFINDVRVWSPKPDHKPEPRPEPDLSRGPRVDRMIRDGADARKLAIEKDQRRRAATIGRALRELRSLPID